MDMLEDIGPKVLDGQLKDTRTHSSARTQSSARTHERHRSSCQNTVAEWSNALD
jgi:hypothetical protein